MITEFHRTRGNRNSTLGGHTQDLDAPGHRRKSTDILERLGKPHLLVLEGLLPRWGGWQGGVLANTKDPQQTKQF